MRTASRARSGFDVDRCWLSFARVSGIVVQGDLAKDAGPVSCRILFGHAGVALDCFFQAICSITMA
jgi:hypothetical protein